MSERYGRINLIRLSSLGRIPILVPEGDVLVGARQNRVTNITVLLGPGEVVELPVSCVEQGRWSQSTSAFESRYVAPASLRASKLRSIFRISSETDAYALPASQRSHMTFILRKLLASSTYAISNTLNGLASKLENAAAQSEKVDTPPDSLTNDWEELDELADEWESDDEPDNTPEQPQYTPEQLAEIREETARLREFYELGQSIVKNSKGEVLLTALRRGFAAADAQKEHNGATLQQKVLIFTESRRTQEYLLISWSKRSSTAR